MADRPDSGKESAEYQRWWRARLALGLPTSILRGNLTQSERILKRREYLRIAKQIERRNKKNRPPQVDLAAVVKNRKETNV